MSTSVLLKRRLSVARDQGLSFVPSPSHRIVASSSLLAKPPAAIAAATSDFARLASALDNSSASRALNELAKRLHFSKLPA